ncbi:MAG: glycerol-3-phosphate O-acyltransferase, partial [Thermodesulfobacteriota bacterium]|nr:glycerol-3-phosphate O-acyltransferase [Thermodesulfobacteriota bacterium]
SYLVVLNFLKESPQGGVDAKERIKKIHALGNRMYKINEIELNEALSKVNYTNALDFFTNKGIKGSEDTDKITFYRDAVQKYLSFLQ